MVTVVALHAHPDDESIITGGTLARAAAEGHRVVLVFATRGELGEVPDGFLDEGEDLGSRRTAEAHASAKQLGAERVSFLGYLDSGMVGEETNDDPTCFWRADTDEAAALVADILRAEDASVLIVYDDYGNYGHPDHIKVHEVGHAAAKLAETPHVLEVTMDRDHIRALIDAMPDDSLAERPEAPQDENFGKPASDITTVVDVSSWTAVKRASMASHASQIGEESFFLSMSDELFSLAFGTEWYIHSVGGATSGPLDWLLTPNNE